jgi:Holliday junction resolvasome RuvABC endonuclease subunit
MGKPHSNILGIDPANTGAAVFLSHDKSTVVGVLWERVYRNKQRVFRVTTARPHTLSADTIFVPTIAHVGNIIASLEELQDEPFKISIEDIYISRNPAVGIALGKMAGMLLAPIMVKYNKVPHYVKANTWRQQVLGVKPRTKRETCKKLSLQLIPCVLPCISSLKAMLGEHDHLTDAAGIALWLHQKI